MGDAKKSEEYFQEVIQKARKIDSEHLSHYLVNYGLVSIQLVRNRISTTMFILLEEIYISL